MTNEIRTAQGKYEIRAEEDGGITVKGHAAVFGEEANIGGLFREKILEGAFSEALKRNDDVVFLVNHAGLPLARTRSGTLSLSQDAQGLVAKTTLDASDPDVQSIIPKMRRGDLDKMSFAFTVTDDEWDEGGGDLPIRTIKSVELYDVSIVTTPAYEGTDIGLRSLEAARKTAFSIVPLETKARMAAKASWLTEQAVASACSPHRPWASQFRRSI